MKIKNCYIPLYIPVVTVEVTGKCNSRCLSCNNWKLQNQLLSGDQPGTAGELEYPKLRKVIGQLKALGTKKIVIHGGEPTLYPELPELMEYCTTGGLSTFMTTNGISFTRELVEEAVRCGLTQIKFSIDGPGEMHNHLRGRDDAYARILETLEFFNRADPKDRVQKWIRTNVSSYNLERIDEVLEIARQNKIRMVEFAYHSIITKEIVEKTNDIFDEPVASLRSHVDKSLLPGNIEMIRQKKMDLLVRAKKLRIILAKTRFFTGTDDEILGGVKRSNEPCWNIYSSLVVDSFGYVYPCEYLRYSLGNIREQSIMQILKSNRYREFTKIYSENYKDLDICRYCNDYL